MLIPVKSILGLAGIPMHRTSATRWLIKAGVQVFALHGDRRLPEAVSLSDLPEPVRRAVVERQIEASGLALGSYDDEAHGRFAELPASMRAAAERKAEIARLLLTTGKALSWPQKLALVKARFGAKGVSQPSLQRLSRAVKGVDPINFAPALVAGYSLEGAPQAAVSGDAWSMFLTTIRDAGEHFPLQSAWCDVRDVAPAMDWDWPSWPTLFRRWQRLSLAQQLHARLGHSEAVKRLAQPAMRDKTTILPLEWVSLDGRTKDFWAHNGDGKPRRYTFLALVDCATNFVLDWELAESENARATVRLIKRTCKTYGIFDNLYPDNGSAFAGHLVAGGAVHKFRNAKKTMAGVQPLGICHHLGIRLHFAIPANGQAKTAERTFACLSRVIDDRPEFKGAHAGHKPGAAPDAGVVPVHLDAVLAVLTREVARHNAKTGRRGQGMNGRSYQAAFEAGLALRVQRKPTSRQLYLAGLIYTPVSVDRWGRVKVENWTYGQPDTQQELLPYHQSRQPILLGRDPDDFSAPALAWNEKNELICAAIMPVAAGAYGSVDGIRDAARNRKAAREAVKAGAAANAYLTNADLTAAMAAIPTPDGPTPAGQAIVAGQFGGKLKTQRRKPAPPETTSAVPLEYLRNMDARLADIEAGRKPKLA